MTTNISVEALFLKNNQYQLFNIASVCDYKSICINKRTKKPQRSSKEEDCSQSEKSLNISKNLKNHFYMLTYVQVLDGACALKYSERL